MWNADHAKMKWMRRLAANLSTGFRIDSPRVLPPATSLLDMPGFIPPGFVHGVEIINENETPTDFVIAVLMTMRHWIGKRPKI